MMSLSAPAGAGVRPGTLGPLFDPPGPGMPPASSTPQAGERDGHRAPPVGAASGPKVFHRSGRVVLVDDDPGVIDIYAGVFPRSWRLKTFLSATSCLNYLQQEPPLRQRDLWAQQAIVAQSRKGAPLVPLLLQYWADSPGRLGLTSVCVSDHLMPGMDGLEMLDELVGWHGRKLLLSGWVEDDAVREALERRAIDHSIPKLQPDFAGRLRVAVDALMALPDPQLLTLWNSCLADSQLQAVSDAEGALAAYAQQRFVEWVVLGDPFGVLGLRHDGSVGWLQLERSDDLSAHARLACEANLPPSIVQLIRRGHYLTNLPLLRQMPQLPVAVVPAMRIAPHLLAAEVNIGAHLPARFEAPWEQLSAQNESVFHVGLSH